MFEGLFRPSHLLIVLLIVVLVFGPSKLPHLGGALGKSIRDFKKAMSEPPDAPAAHEAAPEGSDRKEPERSLKA
jgi:sec-independent protein translocase protein TatA